MTARKSILFLCLPLILLAGCGQVIKTKTFTHSKDGFSIQYPETWTAEEGSGVLSLLICEPDKPDNSYRDSITVTTRSIPDGFTLDDLLTAYFLRLKSTGMGFEEISDEIIEFNGLKAEKINYKFTVSGDKLQFLLYMILHDNVNYTITCASLAEDFDDNLEYFEKTCESFKVSN